MLSFFSSCNLNSFDNFNGNEILEDGIYKIDVTGHKACGSVKFTKKLCAFCSHKKLHFYGIPHRILDV